MDGSPAELRGKAERYRRLASTVTDAQALKALCKLAARYEALAAELEKTGSTAGQNSLPPRDIG